MEKLFGPSWRTSLTGILGAVWFSVQPFINKGDFDIKNDWRSLVYAGLFGAFGFLSKDKGVTGGTIPNEPNDASTVKDTAKKDA